MYLREVSIIGILMLLLFTSFPAMADEEGMMTAEEFLGTFQYQSGVVDLPNGVAFLDVPDTFKYIGPEDAQRFLEDGWGNPDGSGTLGMLLPTGVDLFGNEGWAVVITYQEDGYVSDKDAGEIDYDELLASMKESTQEANKEREKLGYEPLSLVGWATAPRYDAESKKMYWAKELQFGGNDVNTLNYNVRILGRKGVLVMNAVAGMPQLAQVESDMNQVLAFTEFKEGHRYAEFDPGVDKVAAYGLAALIGGKVAAKVGLLAKMGGILLAFKKFILIGIAAIGGTLAKVFKRKPVIVEPTLAEAPQDENL